jgi:predicted NBD/HSP70 family sugar kinase
MRAMKKRILVLDVGGTNVKIHVTGQPDSLKVRSGRRMTPRRMMADVRRAAAGRGWEYDAISIGVPAPVARGKVLREPANLGRGWTRFDFEAAVSKPVRIVNDAAMQALGSYQGGSMLFLGLGTGLGSALIVDGVLVPLELARLPFRGGEMEDYVGRRGLEKHGKRRWRTHVAGVVAVLRSALVVDYVVLGGGNARRLKTLPEGCRLGSNAFAFTGGERLWAAPATRSEAEAEAERRSGGPEISRKAAGDEARRRRGGRRARSSGIADVARRTISVAPGGPAPERPGVG